MRISDWSSDVCSSDLRFLGKLGAGTDVETGKQAARLRGLNIISQARAALGGSLDRVKRCVKLGGFVNFTGDFLEIGRASIRARLCLYEYIPVVAGILK